MEIKEWSYEEFPEFSEEVEGITVIPTTGEETGIRYFHDVEYAHIGDVSLHLQILRPTSRNHPKDILPCVVFVQGSAWMEQDVYAQLPLMARLAEKGYVVACVEYRHSGIAIFPAQALDARNAVRFMRKNADEYGIDPEKMIIAGDSSGGHTAMFAGIIHNDQSEENLYPGISGEVKGIINLYGSVSVMMEDGNPSTLNHHMPDSPEGLEMGGVNLKEHPQLCKKLSVECNITEDTEIAPVLIFHGTKDRTVNTRESIVLYQTLIKAGKKASCYLIQGADHSGAEFWTETVLEIEDQFIKQCVK